ncbi:MAG TPA: tRNA (adenosine(37)-N6)-threonylcarbamoyltransferase complex ATPase subunit type 1 TsaE [bacterium]|nr:tRNA (adenosine(37)-N6)-threonylcarbamoyltransferase complex ATPase subunit type 1 TsaE [bacterium]
MKEFISRSEKETIAFAKKFAKKLKPGAVVTLEGDLGSGKTTFIKGIALGLGLKDQDEVKSPTFAIMHVYPTKPKLYHFDLYRFESPKDAEAIGFEEFTNDPEAVSCVEWPERAAGFIPGSAIRLRFEVTGENARKVLLP